MFVDELGASRLEHLQPERPAKIGGTISEMCLPGSLRLMQLLSLTRHYLAFLSRALSASL
jgi:hypothetical protein